MVVKVAERLLFSTIIRMFQTEIIKLSTLKSNLSTLLSSISAKYQPAKDYDVTIIVKETDHPASSTSIHPRSEKKNNVGFKDSPVILNQDVSESCLSLDDTLHPTRRSIKSDTPAPHSKPPHTALVAPKLPAKIRFKRKEEEKENESPRGAKNSMFTQTEKEPELCGTEVKIECSSRAESQRFSYKLNNLEMESSNSDEDSEEADGEDGGFLIENYLNGAVELIEGARMEELEDFLYKFKEKHSFINVRAEAKWSLLMGYCKEAKMEFERAATNYSQVVAGLLQNPMMMAVEVADVQSRLGRCYFEIGEWNKAIAAYSQALNRYRHNKKCLDYANCISNLGVLYLEIGYLVEAERCFLMAFNIKRAESDRKSRPSLLQTYFHLFDCNIKLRNLIQCEHILGNCSSIIQDADSSLDPLLRLRFLIRCGKLLFLQGQFELALTHYHYALAAVKRHNLSVVDHAEALELMGLLKQEQGQLQRSKFYVEKAYHCMQKFVPIESSKLAVLKQKLEVLNDALAKDRLAHKHKPKQTLQLGSSHLEDSDCDDEEPSSLPPHILNQWRQNK